MTTPPIIHSLSVPTFRQPESHIFSNGVTVYGFPGIYNDITRVDFVLDSGRWTESYPLVAHSVAKLFKSGTPHKDAYKMSEAIDHLGSTVSVYAGYHGFNICVYAMRKNLIQTLELVYECMTTSYFPDSEIDNYLQNALAKLLTQEEKTDFVAERKFKNLLFGDTHPYGYTSEKRFLEAIDRNVLLEYFQQEVQSKQPTIFLSGIYDEKEIKFLEEKWGRNVYPSPSSQKQTTPITNKSKDLHRVEKKQAAQSSLMLGHRSINKNHPDYATLAITNTIFGGYFGSRLMSNIREDKGYTYGIYSSLQTYRYDGVIQIQTETSPEHVQSCIEEIEKEIHILQQDLMGEEELKQARNYLLGKYLSRMDGAFAQMETFKNYMIEGVNIKYFNNFADIIASITPQQIRDTAQQYYRLEEMHQVIVGK